ncbi:ExbD/TolR family protein [Tranquillimonas alkanivorans]|uniref:Outer membrane transport energization protein ExbD n=1 Tax=Tranquillimonas alkanivorans TaxID=441119 RepID=A0A1I5TH33_9RHOB|nr:biopolymer transporter ExbD [Tranquillimonas alkanivorans]SFP82374.1 outer membrane transport energization protein ExbD [Tranquillimonas alkanivorans]
MRFDPPPRKPAPESVVPMINVVFLLLIFFLMAAQITPPAPFEVEPPEAEVEDAAETGLVLHLAAAGTLGFRDAVGEDAALAALSAERTALCGACDGDETPPVVLRADAGAPAAAVAALLSKLGAEGVGDVSLITVRP